MHGRIPDARNAVFNIWRTYEDDPTVSDVSFYLKLNHSRLVTSTLRWRPELRTDIVVHDLSFSFSPLLLPLISILEKKEKRFQVVFVAGSRERNGDRHVRRYKQRYLLLEAIREKRNREYSFRRVGRCSARSSRISPRLEVSNFNILLFALSFMLLKCIIADFIIDYNDNLLS